MPQRKITRTAATGFASYGNQIGLATGHAREYYHPGYEAKRMELGAVIAAAPSDQVRRERPSPGDVVILLGGRTGRDGIGGATGSSQSHTEDSAATSGAEVQKGNPIIERNIQRLFRDPNVTRKIKRCNDFGAGGVSVAIGELADGLTIDLDAVPLKYPGLNGTEIALSESQERMAVVVEAQDAAVFIDLARCENLEATIVAQVTEEPRLVMTWRGQMIVNLERSFIDTNGAAQKTSAVVDLPEADANPAVSVAVKGESFAERLKTVLSDLNQCSQKGLVEMFDSTVGSGTVLMPYGGSYLDTPEQGMAALIPVFSGETTLASVMTHGFDPPEWSPFHGAIEAVVTSLARIVALGADYRTARLTFQEYFERLTTANSWGKPVAALLGALVAQMAFQTPSIGGKDSMSGTFEDIHVPPTLVSFAVTTMPADFVLSSAFVEPGCSTVLLPVLRDDAAIPDFEMLRKTWDAVHKLVQSAEICQAAVLIVRASRWDRRRVSEIESVYL